MLRIMGIQSDLSRRNNMPEPTYTNPSLQHMHEMMQETDRVLAQIRKDREERLQPVKVPQYERD